MSSPILSQFSRWKNCIPIEKGQEKQGRFLSRAWRSVEMLRGKRGYPKHGCSRSRGTVYI